MGLKANVSFLKDYDKVDDKAFLENLDLRYEQKRISNLERQICTTKNIAFGEFDNIKIIAHPDYPLMGFSSMDVSEYEERLIYVYKAKTILSIGLHSSMNLFGYSLIEKGTKVRVNSGSIEGKLFEGGSRTIEEKNVFDRFIFHEDKDLYFSRDGKRYGGEDMFGEELAVSLLTRLINKPFDEIDLSKVQMRPYLLLE